MAQKFNGLSAFLNIFLLLPWVCAFDGTVIKLASASKRHDSLHILAILFE